MAAAVIEKVNKNALELRDELAELEKFDADTVEIEAMQAKIDSNLQAIGEAQNRRGEAQQELDIVISDLGFARSRITDSDTLIDAGDEPVDAARAAYEAKAHATNDAKAEKRTADTVWQTREQEQRRPRRRSHPKPRKCPLRKQRCGLHKSA